MLSIKITHFVSSLRILHFYRHENMYVNVSFCVHDTNSVTIYDKIGLVEYFLIPDGQIDHVINV